MLEEVAFRNLIRRVRAGDEAAAEELVRQYEPVIRRAIRVRLDPRMHRVLDSVDICQSVLGNFFVRAASGQFDLDSPDQLLRLLVTMAKNRLTDHARREHAVRRDNRRVEAGGADRFAAVAGREPTPSQDCAHRELLDEIRRRLTPDERYLAEQRANGRDWADIAAELGESPEALRKRLSRAIDRVAPTLGLEQVSE
jgi:RNA polymerase sigma-70 factor (ECF subfamily)